MSGKETGVLLPVASLPSRWGIGELGSEAYKWVDMMQECGIKIWQILPLNPVGYGNSPYQPYSSYAGDELYISLEMLYNEGLLSELPEDYDKDSKRIDYDNVRLWKEIQLRKAFLNFCETQDYREFIAQTWVESYGVFRALKKKNGGTCWNEWARDEAYWPELKGVNLHEYDSEIRYHMFLQYQFYKQWMKLREYANNAEIKIMGDVPFYVGLDSQDVWGAKKSFLLDDDAKPTFIAGVPPDYFSESGQRWGNPIYDWELIKMEKYRFWVERIGYAHKMFDLVRIDHFRAFDTYWKIPISCPTAVEGEWIEAPGYEVIDTLNEAFPDIGLVAEDLGELRAEVHILKDHYGLKGMKILQFSFDFSGKYAVETGSNIANQIIYTGTHDNATSREWYESLSAAQRRKLRKWLKMQGFGTGSVVRNFLKYMYLSESEYAIVPAYDFLEMGKNGRINVPGTVGRPNWEWKLDGLEELGNALRRYESDIKTRVAR